MALIKSALEIALERTRDVKSDPETIKIDNLVKEGQKLASDYLNDLDIDDVQLAKRIKNYKDDEKDFFIQGIKKTLLSNLNLPKNENYEDMLNKVRNGLKALNGKSKNLDTMIEQIRQFFSQYLENRIQLQEALKKQYAPRLMKKQQELAERYGQEVTLSPEQDPEFMEILKSNLQQMEQQYNGSLVQAKEDLEKFLQ